MSESKHLPKIDLRGLKDQDECPFIGTKSVRCVVGYETDPSPWNQYVCECIEDEPAPQSRGD